MDAGRRRAGSRRRRRRPAAAAALAALLGLPAAGAAGAQEPGDAAEDTAAVSADTAHVPADTADRRSPGFPALAAGVDSAGSGEVHAWGREDLLGSSALTVADFLTDRAPGLLPLRANFYFGPHHLTDGLLGPGAVRVVVDGRQLPPLASAQADLARLALARVDRLRVVRRAGEVVVHVTTPRHAGGDAYSRITGGTGQPAADLIRGVFTNGAGRNFAVAAAVDHLNVGAASALGSRLDAWGKLSWMPFDSASGVEVLWHSDAMDRMAVRDEDFTRSEILLHGRLRLEEGVQMDVWGGRTKRDPAPPFLEEEAGGGAPPAQGDGEGRPALDVAHGELGVTAARGPLTVEGNARFQDASGLASFEADLRAAVRVAGGLSAHGSWHHGSWETFGASTWSGGVTFRPDVPSDLALRAEASTGTRGLARPGREADSLSFDALAGSAEIGLGPYRLSGRATRRTVGRRLPFGGDFDRGLAAGPEATVVGLEGSASGPLVPMEVLEDRLRVEGFWRRNTVESGPLPLYVPGDLARAEFRFQDTYFGGNLGVRALVQLLYRGPMRTAVPGSPQPAVTPEESTVGTSVVVRVDTFRLWWRVDNVRRAEQRDFAGLPFPRQRNVVGVTWEFLE